MTPPRKIVIFAAVFLASGVLFAAQQSLKVDIDLVLISAGISDSDNRLVTNLKSENFQLFEDKVEQNIKYFSSKVEPVSIGIVFDLSHSMEKKLSFARDAAVKFLQTGTPD